MAGVGNIKKPKLAENKATEGDDQQSWLSRVESKLGSLDVGTGIYYLAEPLPNLPNTWIKLKSGQTLTCPVKKEDLSKFAETFGKGKETVVDEEEFRKSWELNPTDFMISNPAWSTYVEDQLLSMIQKNFGISTQIRASLYKMLLYKTGSFFKPVMLNRDAEKEDGMFATLVIQLPSIFEGGQFVFRHEEKNATVDFSSNPEEGNQYMSFFTAFYCNCEHEILPLLSGQRLCLVYNLCMIPTNQATIPKPPKVAKESEGLLKIFQDWNPAKSNKNGHPNKVVYLLAHRYSTASFKFDNLKGEDRGLFAVLSSISEEAGLFLVLAKVEKIVVKEGVESNGYYGGGVFIDSNESEDGEGSDDSSADDDDVQDRMYHLTEIVLHGIDKPWSVNDNIEIEREEIIPAERRRTMKLFSSDEEVEMKGNAPPTFAYVYRQAAIVVFSKNNIPQKLQGKIKK